jgi:DNA-binding NarL/FixJ family response regulator
MLAHFDALTFASPRHFSMGSAPPAVESPVETLSNLCYTAVRVSSMSAESEQEKIRILIADDHPPFAQGLSKLLAEQPDLVPVGIARDGEEAVRLALELKPDVVVMDTTMPRMNGIEATRLIKSELPNTTVLVLSAYDYHSYVLSALEAGAGGYLLKDVPMRELISAIRGLCAGEMVLDQKVAEKLLRSLAKPLGDVGRRAGLSPTELEVLKLGAHGLNNREIGDRLSVSERTVQSHFTSVFQKLEVGSRIEAVLKALKEGWLTMNDIP